MIPKLAKFIFDTFPESDRPTFAELVQLARPSVAAHARLALLPPPTFCSQVTIVTDGAGSASDWLVGASMLAGGGRRTDIFPVMQVMFKIEGAYALIFKSRHYPNELVVRSSNHHRPYTILRPGQAAAAQPPRLPEAILLLC